jgi:hypothetical protein
VCGPHAGQGGLHTQGIKIREAKKYIFTPIFEKNIKDLIEICGKIGSNRATVENG